MLSVKVFKLSLSFFFCLFASGGMWRKARPCRPSTRRAHSWRGSTSHLTFPPSSPSTASASSTSWRGWCDTVSAALKDQKQNQNATIEPNTTSVYSLQYYSFYKNKFRHVSSHAEGTWKLRHPITTLEFTFLLHSLYNQADTSQQHYNRALQTLTYRFVGSNDWCAVKAQMKMKTENVNMCFWLLK